MNKVKLDNIDLDNIDINKFVESDSFDHEVLQMHFQILADLEKKTPLPAFSKFKYAFKRLEKQSDMFLGYFIATLRSMIKDQERLGDTTPVLIDSTKFFGIISQAFLDLGLCCDEENSKCESRIIFNTLNVACIHHFRNFSETIDRIAQETTEN